MPKKLKPLNEQVVVIAGATSGIGLATARMAAEKGARLVLAARNDEALEQVVQEIEKKGGHAVAVTADVANRDDVIRIAEKAKDIYGGFDTWVNNAAVAIYGTVMDVPLEDQKRLIDVNYWGVVHGSLIAAEHLQSKGGAIINLGSVLSDRALIMQGPYCASKHAVKAFTDTLRMEIEEKGWPVSVTLIKPSGINTPYMEHARLHMDAPGASNPPPAYDPSLVAQAVCFAMENPKRSIVVGFGGYAISLLGNHLPRLTDWIMTKAGRSMQQSENVGRPDMRDNLYDPRQDGDTHSSLPGNARKTSLFLESQIHPLRTLLMVGAVGASFVALALAVQGKRVIPARLARKGSAYLSKVPETLGYGRFGHGNFGYRKKQRNSVLPALLKKPRWLPF
jgi:NADP-dependent 3-hydroxy acid dehydrogenase YdfG